jgi:hypothetical protein
MAYEFRIDAVVEQVLQHPEVRAAIEHPPAFLNDPYVRTELGKRTELIRAEAIKQIDDFERVENEVSEGRSERARLTAVPGSVETSQIGIGCLGLIGVISLIYGYLVMPQHVFDGNGSLLLKLPL